MISFIIPAHNEELWIGKRLSSIRTAMKCFEESYEIIVADDASTDSTAELAKEGGTIRGAPSDGNHFGAQAGRSRALGGD